MTNATMEERQKNPEDLGKDLKRIYSDAEGQLPDFTRLDGKQSSRLRSLLVGALVTGLVMAAAVWAGVFFFSRTSGFTGGNVALSYETDEAFTAGGETDVTVHYKNGEHVPLAQAVLEVKVPDGFQILDAEPAADKDGNWPIGAIAPGGEGRIRIHGSVRRELNAALTFEATLEYKPADFNSDFQKVASHTVIVKDSALSLSGTGTQEVAPGDPVSFVFTYENTSDKDLAHVRLTADAPDGFIFASAEPAADPDVAMQWTLDKLAARSTGTITINGTFSATSRGPKSMAARMGFVDEQEKIVPLAEAQAATDVLKSNLDLTLIVNGSETPVPASFGDTLFFAIRYENAGDVPLKDVTLSAKLPSEPSGTSILDWVSLKNDQGAKRADTTLLWTKKELPALSELKPGDKGEIDFSVPLVRKPFPDAKTSDYVVHAMASAAVAKAGDAPGRQVDTAPFDVHLLSDTSFDAAGRYFTDDGTPYGSGPLPPEAHQKTVYRVFWTIRNGLHELTNLTVSTVLPQGAKWTGVQRQVDAGTLTFDDTGRQAVWRLNKMPTTVNSLTVSFDVELTPEAEDIGKIMDLTGDNRLEAFDSAVNAVILKTAPPVGTDLVGDDTAAGKGVVKE